MKKYINKILLAVFTLLIGFTVSSCGSKKTEYNDNVPVGSLTDKVYAKLENITLTEKDLYNEMRSNGYSYLLNEISKILLPASKYDINIDDNHDELIDIINEQCYGTKEIEDLNSSTKKEKVEKFVDEMFLLNVHVTADNIYTDECLTYFTANLAQEYYAKSLITDENSIYYYKNEYQMKDGEYVLDDNGEQIKNTYYISEEALEKKYNSSYKNDVEFEAIILAFRTLADLENAVVAAGGAFTDDGAISTDNAETLFDTIFTYTYGYKETDYILTDEDVSTLNSSLVTLIGNLEAGEYTLYPQQFGDLLYLVYSISGKTTVEYDEITDEKKQEIVDDIIDGYVTSSFISTSIRELMADTDIVIYDPVFDAQYAVDNADHKRLNKKDWKDEYNNYVAKVGDKYIYVNSSSSTSNSQNVYFYDVLESQLGVTCAMDYFTNHLLLDSEYAEKLTDEDIKKIESSYKTTLESFNKNSYASSGYPTSLGEEIFKFLYYGTSDKNQIIEYYKAQKIWDYVALDYPADFFEIVEKFGKQYYDYYFDLSVKHVLLFVDYDMDGTPDDPELFRNKLSATKQVEFDMAIVNLMDAIVKEAHYLVDDMQYCDLSDALTYIANQYAAGEDLLSETKSWNEYKLFNIGVKVEDLGSVNNSNASNYVPEFGEGVQKLYKELVEKDLLGEDYLASEVTDIEQLIKTTYGFHILGAYDSKEITSAEYTSTDDPAEQYKEVKITWLDNEETVDAYSENDYPSINQLKIYFAEMAKDKKVTSLPTDVKTSIGYIYSSITTRYSDSSFQNIYLAYKYLNKLEFSNTENADKFAEFLEIQKREFDDYEDYSVEAEKTLAGWWDYFLTNISE